MNPKEVEAKARNIITDITEGRLTPEEGMRQLMKLTADIAEDPHLTQPQKKQLLTAMGIFLMAGQQLLVQRYNVQIDDILKTGYTFDEKHKRLEEISQYISEFKIDDSALQSKLDSVKKVVDVQEKIYKITTSEKSLLDKYRQLNNLRDNLPSLPEPYMAQIKQEIDGNRQNYQWSILQDIRNQAQKIVQKSDDPFQKLNELRAYVDKIHNTTGIDSEFWNEMDKTAAGAYVAYAYVNVFTEIREQMYSIIDGPASKENKIAQLVDLRSKVVNSLPLSEEKDKFLKDIDEAINRLSRS